MIYCDIYSPEKKEDKVRGWGKKEEKTRSCDVAFKEGRQSDAKKPGLSQSLADVVTAGINLPDHKQFSPLHLSLPNSNAKRF